MMSLHVFHEMRQSDEVARFELGLQLADSVMDGLLGDGMVGDGDIFPIFQSVCLATLESPFKQVFD